MTLNATIKSRIEGLPLTAPLRIEILHCGTPSTYTNAKNMEMSVLDGIIADSTTSRAFKCYSKPQFPFLKAGNTIMLLNFLSKPNEEILRHNTKVIRIPKLDKPVTEDIKQAALATVCSLQQTGKSIRL